MTVLSSIIYKFCHGFSALAKTHSDRWSSSPVGEPPLESMAGSELTEPQAQEVALVDQSALFDQDFYSSAAEVKFLSRGAAARHYVLFGEVQGLMPSRLFDPTLYAELYPDVAQSKGGLLAHYERHGRQEGRIPIFDIAALTQPGSRSFDPAKSTIAVVTHELSATGAPILAWNLVKKIPIDWNVIVLNLNGGVLKENFLEVSTAVVDLTSINLDSLAASVVAERIVDPIRRDFNVTHMILNTALTNRLASAASYLGLPTVILIHEFSEYLPTRIVEESVIMADHVVFSSNLTKHSAEHAVGLALTHSSVMPQGRSEIPHVETGFDVRRKLETLLESSRDRFLVIGCGHFQIRKGVDGFVSAAKYLADELGPDRVLFLWVGNGYDPDTDHAYSVWIKDQIIRSKLSDVVHILPGLDGRSLANLYLHANVMFLSSRLDPFPNVAIDAIVAGLPVVCYEDATGVAEHLLGLEDGSALVASYLDVSAASEKMVTLAKDSALYSRVSDQLRAFGAEQFSFDKYVQRLLDKMSTASQRSGIMIRNTDVVIESGVVDPEYMLPPGSTENIRSALLKHLRTEALIGSAAVTGRRRLFPGHSAADYVSVGSAQTMQYPPIVEWIKNGKKPGPWARKVVDLSVPVLNGEATLKTALHIHAHYYDMLGELLSEISGNVSRPDIYISHSSSSGLMKIREIVADYDGLAEVFLVENRGRDIGPMLIDLAPTLRNYELVGHLHTKQSYDVKDRLLVERWRKFLIANTVGASNCALDKNISLFSGNPRLGLAFPEDPNVIGWTENRIAAASLLAELKVDTQIEQGIEFPVGNMFFFRPEAIRPIFEKKFTLADLPDEPLAYDGTTLHALERIWTLVCENEGYEWVTTRVPGVTR